jgi:putative oxidoreductase
VSIIDQHFRTSPALGISMRNSLALWHGPKARLAPRKRRRSITMSMLIGWLETGRRLAERIPYSLVALVTRFAVASVFWRSGETKVDGFFHIKDNTFYLFREEYKVPLLPPDLAAYMATTAEHVFPVLLIIGLASRLSALGLMVMTAVIQLFVYPDGWPDHILWFALLLLILARGPGAISLDHLVWGRAQSAPMSAR